MKRSTFLLISLVVMASMILAACGPAATTVAPAQRRLRTTSPRDVVPATAVPQKTTIIIGVTDQISSLDAADAYSTHDWELIRNTGRTLLRWNPGTSDLVPDLATAMPTISADGLTYTLTLVPGVKFADGSPLDATIYAAQLNRLLTIGPTCPNDVADALAIPYVKSIAAPDASTLVFTLKSKIAYFPQLLATAPYTPTDPKIFPATKCVTDPPAPIYGVGPWYISQLTQNEQVVLGPEPLLHGRPQTAGG